MQAKIFFCRNDVQPIYFLRKGSYAPGGESGEAHAYDKSKVLLDIFVQFGVNLD